MQNMTTAPAHKRPRLNPRDKALRRERIFDRLREGWAYQAIADAEGVTIRRIRQIVSETLQRREVDTNADHAMVQLARLEPALKIAGEALAEGDTSAIGPYLKLLDRLDRYHGAAGAIPAYDDKARERLLAKISRLAERAQAPRRAKAIRAQRSAEASAPGAVAGLGERIQPETGAAP